MGISSLMGFSFSEQKLLRKEVLKMGKWRQFKLFFGEEALKM
jgi:hypothetical protein